jgi:hypothetical protein
MAARAASRSDPRPPKEAIADLERRMARMERGMLPIRGTVIPRHRARPASPERDALAETVDDNIPDRRRRVVLAQALTRLFEELHVATADRARLLGLAPNNRTTLKRYERDEPLGATRDLLDRASLLLGIYKNLRLLYPMNPGIRANWLYAPHADFKNRAPMDVVKEDGFAGLLMLRAILERAGNV